MLDISVVSQVSIVIQKVTNAQRMCVCVKWWGGDINRSLEADA